VSKKRFLGNDVVLVVYQEDGCQPFDVRKLPSQFIQIVVLVTELPPCEEGCVPFVLPALSLLIAGYVASIASA